LPGNAAQTRRPDLAPGCWVLRIQKLSLTNFRNFADVGVEFSDLPNVILGANATGKTNILDAVHILSVGRSHRERREYNLVRFGEEYYRIEVEGIVPGDAVALFKGMAAGEKNSHTVLSGPVTDQDDLYDILHRLRDVGFSLVSVSRAEPDLEEAFVRLLDRSAEG